MQGGMGQSNPAMRGGGYQPNYSGIGRFFGAPAQAPQPMGNSQNFGGMMGAFGGLGGFNPQMPNSMAQRPFTPSQGALPQSQFDAFNNLSGFGGGAGDPMASRGMTKPAFANPGQFVPPRMMDGPQMSSPFTATAPQMGIPPQGSVPYSWGNFGQPTVYGSLNDSLGAVVQNHPDIAGQRVNLNDPSRFPDLFRNGNYIGPNPASNYQGDATYNEDPNWAIRMARGGRSPYEQAQFLQNAGLPLNFSGQHNGFYFVNGKPLPGGEADFRNMFNLQMPGR